jgi:hypothetical protein
MAARKTAAKAPSRTAAREEEAAELHHELLSEKVRSAKLANSDTEARNKREHSQQGDDHFNRRREAGTSETESKATGARQRVEHDQEMHRFAVHEATQAHQQRTAVNAHTKRTHALTEEAARLKNEHAANAERRAEESHRQSMAIKAQQAHATHQAHRRGAAVTAAHLLFGGAGGSAKSALQHQVGGGH